MRKNILMIGYLLIGIFCFLILYLSYIQVIKGTQLAALPQNKRLSAYEKLIHRGNIYDRNDEVLAYSKGQNNRERVYPWGGDTAPVIGFISERYGRTGIESAGDQYLLGIVPGGRFNKFTNRITKKEIKGYDLVLTLDASIQKRAMNLLGQRKGAVVVLNPQSGEILALASSPYYDPAQLEVQWQQILDNTDSPLLNRATQGAYPPGSIFKLITGAAALDDKPEVGKQIFNCPGFINVNGFKLKDNAVHGEINLTKALAVSCNTTFAELGLTLGTEKLFSAAKAFGFEKKINLEIPVRVSTLSSGEKLSDTQLAATAIGQGDVLVSPLQMALVAASFANEGLVMEPYIISQVLDSSGKVIHRKKPRKWLTAVSPSVAQVIKRGMEDAVTTGTAGSAAIKGIRVAGKTGSAENPNGAAHAWFIGFAPVENPSLVVAVMIENAGAGGTAAAPLAREIFATFL